MQTRPMNLGEIGKRVRGLRAELRLTQEELAEKARVATGTIQALEDAANQKRPRRTSIENLQKIAKALGTTVDDLNAPRERIAADNPLLDRLTDEDLLIARAYHDARTVMRQRVMTLLRDGEPVRLTRLIERLHGREDWWAIVEELLDKNTKPSIRTG